MNDIFGTLSGLFTGLLILIFIGLFAWAWSSRRRAAFDEAAALHCQRGFQRLIIGMAQRRQARARPDRTEDETRAAIGLEFGDRFARQFGSAAVDVIGFVGDAEFAERQRRAAEAVGLNRVRSRLEKFAMDIEHEIGARLVENFGAVLVALEVFFQAQRQTLNMGADRAIAQQDIVG